MNYPQKGGILKYGDMRGGFLKYGDMGAYGGSKDVGRIWEPPPRFDKWGRARKEDEELLMLLMAIAPKILH